MQTERQELWRSTHLLTEDKKELARTVLEEIRRGRDVTKTLRSHPLRGGGYLNKSMLVAIYNEMVAAGKIQRRRTLAGAYPHETDADTFRRDDGHGSDETVSMPGQMHLLPHRCAHAQILSAR